jgi:putative SOS response-associated peptidase YedK
MCGRYTLKNTEALARLIAGITGEENRVISVRYNVSPSQSSPVAVSAMGPFPHRRC